MEQIRRALLSVSDKTELVPLAQVLAAAGVELISTGGTAQLRSTPGAEPILGKRRGIQSWLRVPRRLPTETNSWTAKQTPGASGMRKWTTPKCHRTVARCRSAS